MASSGGGDWNWMGGHDGTLMESVNGMQLRLVTVEHDKEIILTATQDNQPSVDSLHMLKLILMSVEY